MQVFKGKRICYLLISILVLVSFAFFSSSAISAAATDPLKEYQAEQEKLQKQMDEQERIIKQQKSQANAFRSEVASLDNKINRLELDAQAADIQLQVAANELAEIKTQLTEAETRLNDRTDLLRQRVADVYVNGDISYVDVLMEASSYSEFLMRFDMLEKIVEQDVNLLNQVKADRALIVEKEALQEKRLSDLEVLKQSKLNSASTLEDLQGQKEELLTQTELQKAEAQKAYDEMEQASNDIADQIRKIQEASGNSGEFSGQFTWPLPGHTKISSDYGMRKHPTLGVNKMHTGIDIPAPKGTAIVAAEAGTVIVAQYNSAYGNMVIIDHGGGVSTLYGHMSSMGVSVNQSVKRGQTIGKVGSTGWSTGNHLHFEVRINGQYVNPWTYLK